MSALNGSILLEAGSGRRPWHGLTATGPALVADAGRPLDTLAELDRLSQCRRYVGYLGYDLGRCFETLPSGKPDDPALPLFAFLPADPIPALPIDFPQPSSASAEVIGSTFTRPAYEAAVGRCLAYIAAGDVFQINLAQRIRVRTDRTPLDVFRDLRQRFPAEYAALLDFGTFALVSNSPELFLRVTRLPDGRRRIVNRPIKGTRPNTPGMADELRQSEKDRAELAMIVDLQRNDLGRICQTGSVRVTEPREIERHPTVLHGVATVEGVLRDDVTFTDVLRATFPCGSITGCPKIRAMQIIDELEPVRRGAYCGTIGWVGGGEMELSVAIRTITHVRNAKDGFTAYVPVGGGIVADSVPSEEYAETMVKAKAMLLGLGVNLAEVNAIANDGIASEWEASEL